MYLESINSALYGVPSQLHGDHGVENLFVAAWIEWEGQGFISVGKANVTAQIGATWADIFIILELHHGRPEISTRSRYAMGQIPANMFGFDILVHGVCGTDLLVDRMSPVELDVFSVNWEALHDETLLDSCQDNNPVDEGSTSWIGCWGSPDSLNKILVESPDGPFLHTELEILDASLLGLSGAVQDADVAHLWTEAFIVAGRTVKLMERSVLSKWEVTEKKLGYSCRPKESSE
ncbi:hypothetical protein FB451DRAFT_1162009 [Mycena latifolia]|nr:hypothetical protein FB451DRAFT_1162009 [Mycena latifolia]